jgi:hypothetical protein
MTAHLPRGRAPDRTPASPRHDPMGVGDELLRFCAKRGRIVAYRPLANVAWISTETGARGCGLGS